MVEKSYRKVSLWKFSCSWGQFSPVCLSSGLEKSSGVVHKGAPCRSLIHISSYKNTGPPQVYSSPRSPTAPSYTTQCVLTSVCIFMVYRQFLAHFWAYWVFKLCNFIKQLLPLLKSDWLSTVPRVLIYSLSLHVLIKLSVCELVVGLF